MLLAASDLQVVTTFEDGSWQPWHYSVEGTGSFNIVQGSAADPVRAGTRSAKSILPAGSKRSEMYLYPPPARDAEMWYGFSVFIPSDYAADPYNDIIAQWHEVPDWDLGEDWRVPPLTLTIQQNQWRVSSRWDTRPVNVGGWDPPAPYGGRAFFDPGAVARGTWTDWVFHVKWSFGSDGVLEVWQNGNKVADRIGPNTYNDQLGNYMKVGIYHPDAPQDINPVTPVKTAWYDEIRVAGKGAVYADVAPGQSGAASTTLRASADATVRDGSYAAQNFGLETELSVKGADAGYRRETYVRFDLTNLSPVTQAKLRLFGRAQTSESIGVTLYRALPTPWTETGLTWSNRPLATGTALGAQTVSGTAGKWYEFDVTAHLQQQRAAGATQVTYIVRPNTSGAAQALFNSDENAANKPQLFVRHTAVEPPTPPGGPVTTVTVPVVEAAYVRDGAYETQNFGMAGELQLKKSGVGSNREIWLKFDLSGSSSISNAKFRMFGRIDSATEAPTVAVYAADGGVAWAEGALTWANRPTAVGTTALATRTVATSTPKWYEWDVTDFLRSEKAAGRNVVTLVLRSLTTTTPHMIFNSDEAATNRPELVVSSSGVTAPAQALVVSSSAVNVAEGGTARFSVRLASQPTGDVTVSASRTSGDGDVSVAAGQTLVFTPANWNIAQEVTLAAAQDADTFNGSAMIQLTSVGLDTKSVTATEVDDDPPVTPVVLRASADAFVRGGAYAATNYGADTTLAVKYQPDAGYARESYLRFDLTAAPDAIASAKLRLFGRLNETAAAGVAIEVHGVEGADWGEGGINWDNRPVPATGVLATKTIVGTTSAWYEIDLTTYLQQQRSAGAAAVTLVLRGSAASNAQCVFQSDETAANRPELVIAPAASI